MLNINIKTIEHSKHRYSTLGDYYTKDNQDIILVSEMSNSKYEVLIAIHELVELVLTRDRGISEECITKWDIEHLELEEPGDHVDAPYHREHMFASKIEKMLADELGIDWIEYNKMLDITCV